jgi:Baseplate J-like protein
MSNTTPVCPCDGHLPEAPTNLPGLSQIAYRDGTFREFRRALLTPREGEHELSTPQGPVWRPGADGDLAMMIAEWWAYVADILTFYNERIANQDYLRTADLPESVKRLIQLLGYRPRPAIGATATLAALVTPGQSALLPKGLQFQSKPGPGQEAQTFELDAGTSIGEPDAVPANPIAALLAPDAGTLLLQGIVRNISGGDLLLLRERADPSAMAALVTVSQASTETLAGGAQQTRLALASPPAASAGLTAAQASLVRNNQSIGLWSFFGGAVASDPSGSSSILIQLASLARQIHAGDWVLLTTPSTSLGPALLQVTANTDVIWDATGSESAPATPHDANHPLPVPHTQLTVAALPSSSTWNDAAATVSVRFDWIEVGRLKDQPPGPFTGTPPTLLAIQPAKFPSSNDRPVLIQDSSGSGMMANGNASTPGVLTLGNLPAPVPALQSPFSVLYNLLPVSRGKTVSNEVVGSGDAAVAGQSFPLAKSPVTYLEKGASYASTIAIRVDGQPWKEVASFYGQPADARIFVTSEDENGKTHVSFGDGVNGARLRTGTNNIVATYRTGAGAASPPAGKLTVIAQSFPGLKSVLNPVAASGGADPDPPDQIRQYAPRSVLTFGRAVSVFDYEAIAAQAPGVTRVRATWSWDDVRQRTAVTVYVGDDAGAVASAKSVVLAAGDPNRPVNVTLATPIPVLLLLAILVTPGMDADAIRAGVKSALTDPETGLFAPARLRIGQPLFDSQIEAACLSVEGTVAIIASLFWIGHFDPGPLHVPAEGAYYALTPDTVFISTEPDPNGG